MATLRQQLFTGFYEIFRMLLSATWLHMNKLNYRKIPTIKKYCISCPFQIKLKIEFFSSKEEENFITG